jgi:hypothetical protein
VWIAAPPGALVVVVLLVLIVQMVQVLVFGHVFVFATVFVIVHEGESGAAVSSMLAVVRTPAVAVIHVAVAVAVVTGTVVIVDVGVDMTVSVELGVLNIVSSSVGPPLRRVLGTAGVADETEECYAIVVKIVAAV